MISQDLPKEFLCPNHSVRPNDSIHILSHELVQFSLMAPNQRLEVIQLGAGVRSLQIAYIV